MDITRKPFQGVVNIIRFNWHFYLMAIIIFIGVLLFYNNIPLQLKVLIVLASILAFISMLVSLLVSYYVYDFSNLYDLKWLPDLNYKMVLNINAGFDETSCIVKSKYPNVDLTICDFYDKEKHTEVSIKRARAAYSPLNGTIQVSTHKLPYEDNTFDSALVILSAHEIRNKSERVLFFKELKRVAKSNGNIYVTEHLRDLNNFIAYTVGFFHFYSSFTWNETFKLANLTIEEELKINPFITTFILRKNGDSL